VGKTRPRNATGKEEGEEWQWEGVDQFQTVMLLRKKKSSGPVLFLKAQTFVNSSSTSTLSHVETDKRTIRASPRSLNRNMPHTLEQRLMIDTAKESSCSGVVSSKNITFPGKERASMKYWTQP